MSRLCHDCGIADWEPCQCDPRAGLDAPRNPYQERERRRRSTTARIDEQARTVTTTFSDGAVLAAAPNNDAESAARAEALGYPSDRNAQLEPVWAMTRDHERLHTLLAEALGWPYSLALWHAAHPHVGMSEHERQVADMEERTVLLIQRIANDGVDAVWAERDQDQTTDWKVA